MKRRLFIIALMALSLAACRKRDYPADLVQLKQEDIFLEGTADGEPLSLKVGAEGYYCYSSYAQQSDSIYVFRGDLRKYECTSCPRSLNIELGDFRKSLPGATIQVDSSLRIGTRGILTGLKKIHTIHCIANSNKQISSITWNLNNTGDRQDSTIDFEFTTAGEQSLVMKLKTVQNCETTLEQKLFVDDEGDVFGAEIGTFVVIKNNMDYFANIIGGKAPYKYTWYFGDGGEGNTANGTHSYDYAGTYPVKLVLEDADHHVCEANYIVRVGNDLSSCAASVLLRNAGMRSGFLNGARIQWTNSAAEVFSTDNVTQPTESYFEILKSQAYEANERGESGRLLTIRLNVLLSNGKRNMWFKSENAQIAVAYK